MPAAASFALQTSDPSALARPLAEAGRKVQKPTLGLVFVSGPVGQDRELLARVVRLGWPGVPTLVVTGAGVMTEQGELEGAAAAGLLASGPAVTPLCVRDIDGAEGALAEQIGEGTRGTAVVFVSPALGTPGFLARLGRRVPGVSFVGGGAASNEPLLMLDAEGRPQEGSLVGLLVRGPGPRVAVAPGCRPLGGLRTVTEARGNLLLRLDDEPALEALAQAARKLGGRPLVMVLLPDPSATEAEVAADPLKRARLRPVRGVDPTRRAVVLSEPLREGDRVSFAVLDGASARGNLDHALRDLGRQTAGSAARFGLYINCAGRGTALYGAPDVDCKQLRARFAGLPLVGVMSSFELAPQPDPASLHFYTGVFALFTAPS